MAEHLYFSGIGGAGLFPLAQIAQQLGYQVSGSDSESSPHTDWLSANGIDVKIGQFSDSIAQTHAKNPIDWLIATSALPAHHPELAFAKQHHIRLSKRDVFLNEVLKTQNLKLIAISGTHGKTTVTGMLIWLFQQAKQPISYAIGTDISFGSSGQYQSGSKFFIYEADEFDRNFLAFNPYLSVIPSVEYDHSDTYSSVEEYKQAFRDFCHRSHCVFLYKQASDYLDLAHLQCLHKLAPTSELLGTVKLPGLHNRQNGLLAKEAAKSLLSDVKEQLLLTALASFPGTGRRMEKLAENLYSDYAHLPSEIRATLQLAKERFKNVIAIYQPHQNIRQHEIINQYQDCFSQAKKVYWLPTYLSREDKTLPVLSPDKLVKHLSGQNNVEIADMNDKLITAIKHHCQAGDAVILMGAGSIDSWARRELLN